MCSKQSLEHTNLLAQQIFLFKRMYEWRANVPQVAIQLQKQIMGNSAVSARIAHEEPHWIEPVENNHHAARSIAMRNPYIHME
jgi:hypothetical protein